MSPLRFVETTALHLGYYEIGEGPAVVLLLLPDEFGDRLGRDARAMGISTYVLT